MGVGSFPHRPHFLRWQRAAYEPRRPVVIVRQGAAAPWSEESLAHGEYGLELSVLIDIMEFGLVGLLGFMPISVIHWTHRQRRKREVPPLPGPV
jgi:hypothetical protein